MLVLLNLLWQALSSDNFCKPFEIDPFLVGKGFLVFGDQLRRIKVCKQMDIHAGLDHVE